MNTTSLSFLLSCVFLGLSAIHNHAAPTMPAPCNLSKADYARGDLREKDVIDRLTPYLKQTLASQELKLGSPVFIRIFKESRELEVWVLHQPSKKYRLYKTWPIAAMSGKLGPKTTEGDLQAPEGFYYVNQPRMKPDSSFHLAFNIGYPNSYDRAHGHTGGFIMVHGNRVSIGCYAMTNPGIEEIYTLCRSALNHGQKIFRVHSFPFRMTPERMAEASDSKHLAFWKNLKQGHDWFENKQTPPDVSVEENTYRFSAIKSH